MPQDMLLDEFFLFKPFSIPFIIFFAKPSTTSFTKQAFLYMLSQSPLCFILITLLFL